MDDSNSAGQNGNGGTVSAGDASSFGAPPPIAPLESATASSSSSSTTVPNQTTASGDLMAEASSSLTNGDASPSSPTDNAGPRSSGRAVRPTLRAAGIAVPTPLTGEPPTLSSPASGTRGVSGTEAYSLRTRQSRQTRSHRTAGGRAPRLKLSLKSSLPGRTARAGQPKTHAYMQGFEDREMDSSDDETGEGMAFEEQLILRLPEGPTATRLKEQVRKRDVGSEQGEEVMMKFKDSRRAMFKVGQDMFSTRLVDLPSLIEAHKTLDNRRMFKVADISQMLLATHIIKDESEVTQSGQSGETTTNGENGGAGAGADFNIDDFIYPHGITPPMKWARKRRFRKRGKKKQTVETVEQEVQRLLAEDQKADETQYELVDAAEIDDGDEEDGGAGGARGGRDTASVAGTPRPGGAEDDRDMAASQVDEEEEGDDVDESQMGEGSVAGGGEEDGDVDLDLAAELEAALGEEDEEEEDDDDDNDRSTYSRGPSQAHSVAVSEEDEDDEEEDLWDDNAGESSSRRPGARGPAARGGEGDDGDDDGGAEEEEEEDEDDDTAREERVRTDQLEAECREIDSLVKRKQAEADATHNALIKRRQLDALKRLVHERDVKRGRLAALKEERRQRRQENAEEDERLRQQAAQTAQTAQTSKGPENEQDRERRELAEAAEAVEDDEEAAGGATGKAVDASAASKNKQQQQQRGGDDAMDVDGNEVGEEDADADAEGDAEGQGDGEGGDEEEDGEGGDEDGDGDGDGDGEGEDDDDDLWS